MLSVLEDRVGLVRAVSTQGKRCLEQGTKRMDLSKEHMHLENVLVCLCCLRHRGCVRKC